MSGRKLVAVAVADLHLSVDPPVFRSVEEDWLGVQRRVMKEVFRMATLSTPAFQESGATRLRVPVLIPGDLFNRATPTPEVINFALELFSLGSPIVAVAGNHDLPNHRLEEMHRSAYGTLVRAGVILDIKPGGYITLDEGPVPIRVWGYPCGCPVQPIPEKDKHTSNFYLEIALVHSYIWEEGFGRPWASEVDKASSYRKRLKGYDVAVFGDNHHGFLIPSDNQNYTVLNCGTLLVRKRDEVNTSPSVGLIYSDGVVERRPLDTSSDRYSEAGPVHKVNRTEEEEEAVRSLAELEDQELDFEAHLRHTAEKGVERGDITPRAGELILEFLGV